MRALRFSSGRLSLDDIERPGRSDEAVIRVLLSGICNTDIEITRGYSGFEGTLGHEFVGIVERADDRPKLVGKRVVGEINAGCGTCYRCSAGDPRHCPGRSVLGIVGRDGAHAEFLQLPSRNLLEVPEVIPDHEAVFVEPLAAAYGINEQVEIETDTRVAVVGDGKLGLLCALSLARSTSRLTLIGKHRSKLLIAKRSGIETVRLDELAVSRHRSFDLVVEASGSEPGLATALDLVIPRGKIVLKSTFHGSPRWAAARVVVDEISIVGSRCGRFAPALDLLENKVLRVEDLIDSEFSLDRGLEAMEAARRKGSMKILIRP